MMDSVGLGIQRVVSNRASPAGRGKEAEVAKQQLLLDPNPNSKHQRAVGLIGPRVYRTQSHKQPQARNPKEKDTLCTCMCVCICIYSAS